MLRRDQVLEVIVGYARGHGGNSPSQREIRVLLKRRGISLSDSSVRANLQTLEVEGLIERQDGKIVVAGSTWDVTLPVIQRTTLHERSVKAAATRRVGVGWREKKKKKGQPT